MPRSTPPGEVPPTSYHRSGAVARMLRMPVGTLRVWERRYRLTDTAHSSGGQRLYSADDVRRLALLKQLTDLGHAIGTVASLDMAELQRVAATHAQALASTQGVRQNVPAARAWRVVAVGKSIGVRLQRPALLRQLGRALELVGPFDDVAAAAAALAARPDDDPVDAWLLHEPQLHAGWLDACEAAAPMFASAPKAVLYGIGADTVCDDLAARGVMLLREPQPDAVVAQWLRHCADATSGAAPEPAADAQAAARPRRWADDALADFAALSTTVACECPRHVAELLVQLSRFEAYSAQCEHRSPQDAALHAHLGRVAADARASFESALERVALHEGLLLPTPAPA